MDLEHSFTIPVPPEQAWQVLLDVQRIAPCMPGATVDSVDGDVVTGRIKVKVGPVTMTYAGTARFVERDEQSRAVTLEASGKETRGAGTASATIRSTLQGEGNQTNVVVHTTMSVTGRPAQFGRGVMAEVGGRIIERFAANLAALLAGEGSPSAASTADAASTAGAATTAGAASAAEPGAPVSGPAAGAPTVTGGGPAGVTPDGMAVSSDGAVPLDELELPVRAYNSLRRAGIHTVGDLSARTEDDLLAIENLGPQSVREIKQRLAGLGHHLAERSTPAPVGANGAGPPPGTAAAADGATAPNGAAAPGASQLGASQPSAPQAARPPDEDAIDLLSVAGFPVLKRALPVIGVVLVLLLVILGRRSRRRPDRPLEP
jgi:carbon monoxide dehydrogenase subunit G